MKNRSFVCYFRNFFLAVPLLSACGSPSVSSQSLLVSSPDSSSPISSQDLSSSQEGNMNASKKEFLGYLQDLATFPTDFVYGDFYFHGFPEKSFKLVTQTSETVGAREHHILIFNFHDIVKVTLDTSYYEGYDAFDWTVSFENTSSSTNTAVFSLLRGIDYELPGENPTLKGILGDHENNYLPYEKELSQGNVHFRNDLGRSCHRYFPYFNLENDDGGALFALGWSGTWEADFSYDASKKETTYKGENVVDFASYLKPGEKIRTALNAVVRYYERDEGLATNKWRKWIVDCNLPREEMGKEGVIQPKLCVSLANDTGKPNSDGSISESFSTWQTSLDQIIAHNFKADIEWFDAGWYQAPNGTSPVSDWWGTVGTWVMDPKKWPDDSFAERSDYALENGMKTMVWFEPERVTQPTYLRDKYAYDMDWILSDYGNNNFYINNLGDPDCLDWTTQRILTALEKNHIHIYREDFNVDPQIFFTIGDGYQGKNRKGITENLYYQGHYKLWDSIIAFTSSHGGAPYVDSCASGGGRNDLETLRRSVPFLRSDSDRTTIPLRLAFTYSLNKWLPFTGAVAKEGSALVAGGIDRYVQRATYLGVVTYDCQWSRDKSLDYSMLNAGVEEWNDMKGLLLKDYYSLTPYRGIANDTDWSAYEYFDSAKDKGLIQAFRPASSKEETFEVKVKGVDPDHYYAIRDLDGGNSLSKVKGRMLMNGFVIRLKQARSSAMIYLDPIA